MGRKMEGKKARKSIGAREVQQHHHLINLIPLHESNRL